MVKISHEAVKCQPPKYMKFSLTQSKQTFIVYSMLSHESIKMNETRNIQINTLMTYNTNKYTDNMMI